MTRLATVVVAALALAVVGVAGAVPHKASTAGASCRGAVSWQKASRYVGRIATIRGPVVSTKYASSSNGSPTFLNIGADYPSSRRFTVVIRARFGVPERRYRGHTICVRGLVDSYDGVPEIEATSPGQIAVAR